MKKIGKQTIKTASMVNILSSSSIVGKKEGEGPLKNYFDTILEDAQWNEKTWEKTESKMQTQSLSLAVEKASCAMSDIDYLFAGDLLNQCISSGFAHRESNIPYLGIYGACSTFGEGLGLAAVMIDGGFANKCAVVTSSHFCTAERQYRMPLEYGGQRTPTAQWTVTGSGAAIISNSNKPPFIKYVTFGKIVDMGIKDANNMGAAMAPAAAQTLKAHFEDTNTVPSDYDLIISGDLGTLGKEIVTDLMNGYGYDMTKNYDDCGCMIFDIDNQDVHAGGSGCGCSTTVFCGYIMEMLKRGDLNKVLFMPTGALLSPTSNMQGETIPSVAHAVAISNIDV